MWNFYWYIDSGDDLVLNHVAVANIIIFHTENFAVLGDQYCEVFQLTVADIFSDLNPGHQISCRVIMHFYMLNNCFSLQIKDVACGTFGKSRGN